MHFVRLGEFLAASRITGPTHNLLQIRLGGCSDRPPVCERLSPVGGGKHVPLNEAQVILHVLDGVTEANQQLGTNYAVSHIRYVEDDTPPEAAYGLMALRIVVHLHTGGEFAPSISAGP
jgi:hypothetical protein